MTKVRAGIVIAVVPILVLGALQVLRADFFAADPGVRGDPPGAGGRFFGMTAAQNALFDQGKDEFEEADAPDEGLGPRFNLDSCLGCHSQPASGGSSPFVNPQVAMATAAGANNAVPSFIRAAGPVREARYKLKPNGSPDGGVHSLFVTSGRSDAPGCNAVQEDFEAEVAANNVVFRIPTPVFGAGLIEVIPDAVIDANRTACAAAKANFGISGRANRNGNDGTITRFGWKAQNKSLLLFAGEAYNVEMGISNDLFQTERDDNPNCQYAPVPNSVADIEGGDPVSAIEKFAIFMRFLAPPRPSAFTPGGPASISSGRQTFFNTGCALCHTPTLTTGNSAISVLANRNVNLFSDLLLHNMGPGLADDVSQGAARGSEFRTAPLWGLGQRIFFMHDGRTKNLVNAIRAHRSGASARYPASEANASIDAFDALPEFSMTGNSKQDLLNFLRSL